MLRQILAQMKADARRFPDRSIRRTMKHGLRIAVTFRRPNIFRLILSRDRQEPSPQEWATVVNHWGEPVPQDLQPERIPLDFRLCLRADIPIAETAKPEATQPELVSQD